MSSLVSGSIDLPLREENELVEVGGRALLQEVVGEHRYQGRGKGDGAAERNSVSSEPLEHLKQRQVGVDDGFVEPPLLHHRGVIGVPDERQMSVKHEGEVAGAHRASASPARSAETSLAPASEQLLARSDVPPLASAANEPLARRAIDALAGAAEASFARTAIEKLGCAP